jgi:hypothetical protein
MPMVVSWVINHIKMAKITSISELPAFFFRVSDGKSVRGYIKRCNKTVTDYWL